MKPAFSTVACLDWTLERVAAFAESVGALGVELRSFGTGSTQAACDPTLTSPEKVRRLFDRAGCAIACIGTSVRFDAPINPPVLGRALCDTEKSVREAKSAIDLAQSLACPLVRVFAFEIPGSESRESAVARIAERLGKAADHARNRGVRLVLENGGSFATAAGVMEILDSVDSPMIGVAYCPAVARLAGEKPADGLNVLGDRVLSVKLKDYRVGTPCTLGDGEFDVAGTLSALRASGFDGWLIHEHDRAWLPGGLPGGASDSTDDAAHIVGASIRAMYDYFPKVISAPAPRRRAVGV